MGPILAMQLVCLGVSLAAGIYALIVAKRARDHLEDVMALQRAYVGLIEDFSRIQRGRP